MRTAVKIQQPINQFKIPTLNSLGLSCGTSVQTPKMGCGMLVVYSILFLGLVHPTRSQNIFILAGQSNMAGRGGVVNNTWDGVIPHQSDATPSILSLDAHLHWIEAREPLHRDIDYTKTCGIGPGMPFAHALLARHPGLAPLGLVPCAIGGTSIAEWARGTPLYRHMITRARAAAAQGGHVQGIVWFQGERDTLSQADAAEYGHRLLRLLSDWRADLQDPLLPIVLIDEIGDEDEGSLPLQPDRLPCTKKKQIVFPDRRRRWLLFPQIEEYEGSSPSHIDECSSPRSTKTKVKGGIDSRED